MYQFFILFHKTYKPPFRGWLSTATTSRNHAAIPQKEAIESPEMERFWLIKYQRNKGGKIVETCFENSMSDPQRVSRRFFLPCIAFIKIIKIVIKWFRGQIVVSQMARKGNLQAVSSLFAVQFSERSGLVKDVKAAESVLRNYETATPTRFSCFKANKGFGNTGERFPINKK